MVQVGDDTRQEVWGHDSPPIGRRAGPELLLLVRFGLIAALMLSCAGFSNASAQDTQRQARGSVPQSLQEKMGRLQALVAQQQQEGADLQPVGDLMQGFQPLVQEQKFGEAEALVDRALKLAGELKPSTGRTAPEQSSQPLRPQELRPQNQIWGSLRAVIVDQEGGPGLKARCYLTDSADQAWSPSGAITYVKPLERHFIVSGEFQIALPPRHLHASSGAGDGISPRDPKGRNPPRRYSR